MAAAFTRVDRFIVYSTIWMSPNEGGTCSADPAVNLFCLRGLVCNVGSCVKYCDVGGGAPACAANQQCIDFTNQVVLQYGYCH